jgi:uncharacterized OsmC-like protein
MSDNTIRVELLQQQDYAFDVRFGGTVTDLRTDEPEPLGRGSGPSPVQLLAAAVGNCLSDSLLFALRKFKQAPEPLRCRIEAETGRNAEGRMRVVQIRASLYLGVPAARLAHLDRVLATFENFCTVTQSVGQGIAITVEVWDADGQRLQ